MTLIVGDAIFHENGEFWCRTAIDPIAKTGYFLTPHQQAGVTEKRYLLRIILGNESWPLCLLKDYGHSFLAAVQAFETKMRVTDYVGYHTIDYFLDEKIPAKGSWHVPPQAVKL